MTRAATAVPRRALPPEPPLTAVRAWLGRWWPDLVVAGLLTLSTLVVHDVGWMLTGPFWTDEAWVAISTKLPLSQLPEVASATPIGWAFLLRLVPFGGEERLRLVPLVFSALTVVAAYGYARSLPWAKLWLRRLAATLAGFGALLLPSALLRNDLKQYTADAFVTIVALWLVSRVDTGWSRRRLVALGVVAAVGFLFTTAALFVGVAAFASLALVALARKRWPQLIEAAVVGAATVAVLVTTYLVAYRPRLPATVNDFWVDNYPPLGEGLGAVWAFTVGGAQELALSLALGPLPVVVLLVAGGTATLGRLGCVGAAAALPVLLAEMYVLGALHQYPLFNQRTSHFMLTAIVVTAAIGVAGLCALLARVRTELAVGAAVLALALFVLDPGLRASVRFRGDGGEDVRTATRYVEQHLRPTDVVVVGMLSSWGFAYYWDRGTPATRPNTANLQGFVMVYPDQPNILVAEDRTPAAVDAVMAQAAEAADDIGPSARIWVIHDHVRDDEEAAYLAAGPANGFAVRSLIPGRLLLLTR